MKHAKVRADLEKILEHTIEKYSAKPNLGLEDQIMEQSNADALVLIQTALHNVILLNQYEAGKFEVSNLKAPTPKEKAPE